MEFSDLEVRHISSSDGKDFIKRHHYSHGCHNGPMCVGLFYIDTLIGVCAFATPNSENVRGSIFGADHVDRVTELHRLVVLDGTPTNTESFFISRALKWLRTYRPHLWAVVSFADTTEGHLGVIYQATNATYYGMSAPATFYRDEGGRLRHPRQNGKNISKAEAVDRGWTPVRRQAKHRYCFFLRPRHKRKAIIKSLPYPKDEDAARNS